MRIQVALFFKETTMKTKGRIILVVLLGSLLLIQLWQVDKNLGEKHPPDDFIVQNPSLPESLANSIRRSCYDCHSNHTNYPWYAHVAPFSWIINQHINNGKEELNFSVYGSLEDKVKISVLTSICEVISDSTMPPANYLMLHEDAALDSDDISAICDWSEGIALFIMRNR